MLNPHDDVEGQLRKPEIDIIADDRASERIRRAAIRVNRIERRRPLWLLLLWAIGFALSVVGVITLLTGVIYRDIPMTIGGMIGAIIGTTLDLIIDQKRYTK